MIPVRMAWRDRRHSLRCSNRDSRFRWWSTHRCRRSASRQSPNSLDTVRTTACTTLCCIDMTMSPRRFLELLERQPGTSLSAALLEELGPILAALPPALSRGVERLVRRPSEFRDVADLAQASRMTLRTAYRHPTSAGVRSPRALVVAARLLQSYGYARDPRQSLEEIARKVGYSAPRMLTKHMREAVGPPRAQSVAR